ncbi:MAG TPA: serine/threonine-protein phosphatase, partial [Actinobacteria bacterium]|nr:serine/threonine-protein phosphatase [Actinomycetota bacterium]
TVLMVAILRVFEYEFLEERKVKEAMEHDAVVAAEIQNELLPRVPLITDGAQIYARLVQARIVGGDTFDYYESHDDRAVFMIADASGKGSPAALLCMAGLITVETESFKSENPAMILKQTNKRLTKRFPAGSFITAAMGRYFPKEGLVDMASCGQNPPLIYRKKEHCWRVVDLPGSLPMGVDSDAEPSEIIIGVKPGDRLLMYTDGLIDMRNPQGEKVSFENIISWLNAQADLGPSEILDHLVDLVLSISGATLYDDITVLLVHFEDIGTSGAQKAA